MAELTRGDDQDSPGGGRAEPTIGVHVMTEFIYCPRAGVVASEEGWEDTGEDDRPGRLDFVPNYRLREIEDALQRAINWFGLQLGLGLVVFLVTLFWARGGDLRVTWALGGALMILAGLAGKSMLTVVRLTCQRMQVLSAVPKEPEFTDGKPVWINWWQLRAAGFSASTADWQMADDDARLSGKPFRVLCRGSLRIPVFRQRRPTDRLYRQHFARIAAYCHLIEVSSGKQSPFGIVLRGRSYQCVAIPIGEEARHRCGRPSEAAECCSAGPRLPHRVRAADGQERVAGAVTLVRSWP